MAYRPRNRVWSSVAPTVPCVDLTLMRDHLRYSGTEEDGQITAKLLAAQRSVEKFTQRLLSVRAATLRLPSLPTDGCAVELPGGEVASITTFTADGVAVSGTTFLGDSPAIILPADEWPVITGTVYPVTIVYQVGFAACPEDLQHAVMMLAAELFERRANAEFGNIRDVPISAQYLMGPWRIRPV